MTRSLYEINADFMQAIELGYNTETGEIYAADDIEKLALERDTKIENCAKYELNERAFVEALKAQRDAITARIKEHERKANYVHDMLADVLGGEKYETVDFSVTFRKSDKVTITNADTIPAEYLITKTTTEPDLVAINKAIKDGASVPGAEVTTNLSMKVK